MNPSNNGAVQIVILASSVNVEDLLFEELLDLKETLYCVSEDLPSADLAARESLESTIAAILGEIGKRLRARALRKLAA